MSKSPNGEAPGSISPSETRKLWVRSGGRCAICNKYLLEDEFTAQPVLLAEQAHNVGRKRSERSPRGEDDLPLDERNLAENLILLCGDHHKVIDAKETRDEYSVARLREIKARHEDRIEYLTGLGEDQETVVLRVGGDVRGAVTEVAESSVRPAIVADTGRYPRYGLGYRGSGPDLDLRDLPGEGSGEYWDDARRRISYTMQRVRDGAGRHEIRHLSVFAIARIPVLAMLGQELDDKIPTALYDKHRGGDEDWCWDPEAEPVSFELTRRQQGTGPSRAALVLSISGTIALDDLPPAIGAEYSIWELAPAGMAPTPDLLRSRASLDNFAEAYRGFLSVVELEHPEVTEIDVFPAVPLTAAITIGRVPMRDVHPVLRLHDRDDDGAFGLAVELNR